MLSQTNPWLLSALAVVICLLTACASTPQIAANTDPTANLSSYKTYGFAQQPGTNRGGDITPLTTYFETSVSKHMDARPSQGRLASKLKVVWEGRPEAS